MVCLQAIYCSLSSRKANNVSPDNALLFWHFGVDSIFEDDESCIGTLILLDPHELNQVTIGHPNWHLCLPVGEKDFESAM